MKVLIVCEDPTHDQFVVKPVVQQIFNIMGRKVSLDVLTDPHLRGIEQVLSELPGIVDDYPMVDRFLVVVDRDCDRASNTVRITNAVKSLNSAIGSDRVIACLAQEEIEIWMLALHRTELETWGTWQEIRGHCDVKEHVALPWLSRRDFGGPGQGRKAAMRGLGTGWRGVLELCPELRTLLEQLGELQ